MSTREERMTDSAFSPREILLWRVIILLLGLQGSLFLAGEVWMKNHPWDLRQWDEYISKPPWYQKWDCIVTGQKGTYACKW